MFSNAPLALDNSFVYTMIAQCQPLDNTTNRATLRMRLCAASRRLIELAVMQQCAIEMPAQILRVDALFLSPPHAKRHGGARAGRRRLDQKANARNLVRGLPKLILRFAHMVPPTNSRPQPIALRNVASSKLGGLHDEWWV